MHAVARSALRTLLRSPNFWICVLTAPLCLALFAPYWKPSWDSAIYLSLARSLSDGEGYVYMGHPHAKYPPGLPVLLVPFDLVFGGAPAVLRLLMVVFAVTSVGLCFALIRNLAGSGLAWAVAGMMAVTPLFLIESTYVQSDVPFLCLSLAALWAYTRATRDPGAVSMPWLAGAAALACGAFLFRALGLVLPVSLLAFHAIRTPPEGRRSRRPLLVLGVPILVVAGLWFTYSAHARAALPETMPTSSSYAEQFLRVDPGDPGSPRIGPADLFARISDNASWYQERLGRLASGKKRPISPNIIGPLLVFGWLVRLVTRRSLLEIYTGAYAGILLVWPFVQGGRFLVPALPFVIFYGLSGVLAVVDAALRGLHRPAWRQPAYVAALAVAAVAYLGASSRGVTRAIEREHRRPYHSGVEGQRLDAMDWLGVFTPANSVIIADRAAWVQWISRRDAYALPATEDPARLRDFVRDVGATHVVKTGVGISAPHLAALIGSDPDAYEKVWASSRVSIYRIRPADEESVRP